MSNKAINDKVVNDDKFSYILIIMSALIIVFLMDLMYKLLNYKIVLVEVSRSTLLLSWGIVASIMLIIWGITNNSKIALSIMMIVSMLISVINQIKMAYMVEPIFISDIGHLNNIGEILSIIDNTFFNTIKKYILMVIIAAILLAIFIYKLKSAPIYARIINTKKRIITITLPLIILLMLFFPNKTTKNIYLNLFYNANNRQNYNYIVSPCEYYLRYGLVGGIYGQFLECLIYEPEGYNEVQLNNILSSVENNEDTVKWGTPNIIVVLSETFWDISKLKEVEFEQEITPNFNRLKESGILFEMLSPSYGGTTANVEMEFLTGFNLAYYNNGYIPYLQLYNKNKNTPNIIQELKNNGYTTKIISASGEKLFNAKKVYECFGVDEMEFVETVEEKNIKGYYVSDEYITDKIIQEVEKNNKKIFCMALTMQAHMPYEYKKYSTYDINIRNSHLNNEMEEAILSYAQGIYDADKQLGRLNEYIQTLEQPTIVVFFGDHLPYLKTETGKDTMKKLNYFNTTDDILNEYRKYNTEALLIANFEISEKDTKYMSTDLIMPYVLNNIDIELSSYYKWLAITSNKLPSYNRSLATDSEGTINRIQEIVGEMKKQYLLREQLQYMLFAK